MPLHNCFPVNSLWTLPRSRPQSTHSNLSRISGTWLCKSLEPLGIKFLLVIFFFFFFPPASSRAWIWPKKHWGVSALATRKSWDGEDDEPLLSASCADFSEIREYKRKNKQTHTRLICDPLGLGSRLWTHKYFYRSIIFKLSLLLSTFFNMLCWEIPYCLRFIFISFPLYIPLYLL